tara:strand:+ start:368 stop:1489 length:1122 start_codon:yes stop_codon:yes gene_type:complete
MLDFREYINEAIKISANRGDVAEIILGAAVTARFFNSPQKTAIISKPHIYDMLSKVLRSQEVTLHRTDKLSGTVKVDDNIRFKVGVPKKAWEFISDKNNWKLVDDLFDSAISYVNTERRLRGQSHALYANGRVDDIFVNSDGTGDQKGTKADIKLIINGKEAPQQISLKVEGGEQFGQVAGMTFDKQIEIWGRLGINVKPIETKFNDKLKDVDLKATFSDRGAIGMKEIEVAIRAAAGEAYSYATKQLNQNLPADKLISFLKTAANKGDSRIELIKFTSTGYKKAKFGKNFEENLKTLFPKLTIEFEQTTDSIVHIYDKSIGPRSSSAARLFRVRGFFQRPSAVKSTGEKYYKAYMRNIIEAGDLLFKIATDN